MSSTLKFLEKIAGPLTVAMLFRAYRKSNDMTLQDMADLLDVSKGFVSNIEHNRKKLSLEKTLEFAAKMKESKEFYAMVWFEDQARESGLNFTKIAKMKVA